jgi:hypothetical protein
MSNQEAPAPSAPASEIDDDEAGSDMEEASTAQIKRRKTSLTKCDDEYAVSKRREALSVKANTGKFVGLRAVTSAKPSSAKTAKHSGKDFVYGVLFVTLLAFSAKAPANRTAKWFCCCTSDCDYFYDLTGTKEKDRSKLQFTDICLTTLFPRTRTTDALSKTSRPNTSQRLLLDHQAAWQRVVGSFQVVVGCL